MLAAHCELSAAPQAVGAAEPGPEVSRGQGCSQHTWSRLCAAFSTEQGQAQEVCSELFVLDKLFALFVLVSHAELGSGIKAWAVPKQTQHLRP